MRCDTSGCRAEAFEDWIVSIRKTLPRKCKIDWHYSGGIANVLYLGDQQTVMKAIGEHMDTCPAHVMSLVEETGPYRAGVTPAPEGALCGSYNPDDGDTEFIVKEAD
jgi:hypothetical protein